MFFDMQRNKRIELYISATEHHSFRLNLTMECLKRWICEIISPVQRNINFTPNCLGASTTVDAEKNVCKRVEG